MDEFDPEIFRVVNYSNSSRIDFIRNSFFLKKVDCEIPGKFLTISLSTSIRDHAGICPSICQFAQPRRSYFLLDRCINYAVPPGKLTVGP
jgi:hypothetical protein